MKDGTWYCFVGERIPQTLDDELKAHAEEWHRALGGLSVEDIKAHVPIIVPPMFHVDKEKLPGICKFDYKAWEDMGSPCLRVEGWIALCRLIALKQPFVLGHLLDLCEMETKKIGDSGEDFVVL